MNPKDKPKTGTKEWSDCSLNIGIGCAHRCRYCYAREIAMRYGMVITREDFAVERLKDKDPAIKRLKGVVMTPSMHDVTPFYLPRFREVVMALAKQGNLILIVSKPHRECIDALIKDLLPYQQQIEFRFSIGTTDKALAKFWEPSAPPPQERVECLIGAHDNRYRVSVSMEPFLNNVDHTAEDIEYLIQWAQTLWVGKMNNVLSRVKPQTDLERQMCQQILDNQCDYEIFKLYDRYKTHSNIVWKDSIQSVIKKFNGPTRSRAK